MRYCVMFKGILKPFLATSYGNRLSKAQNYQSGRQHSWRHGHKKRILVCAARLSVSRGRRVQASPIVIPRIVV